jgi:DNA processing protein
VRATSPSPDGDPRQPALALAALPGVGGVRYRELVARFGSPAAALPHVGDPAIRAAALKAACAALDSAGDAGAEVWISGGDRYPSTLDDLPDPPPYLFALGARATLDAPTVAVVGTRALTAYGARITRELAGALARAGACVISGLARGVDAAAHVAALDAGGRTAAVLGTGIDVPYPAAHAALHARIVERGLVLSEHAPGERASPGSFPRRNRLIAALSQVTIVVEAGHRSGALITAAHALELGRTVAAVPGPIDSSQSAGTNELLRDGAVVIATVADALALLGLGGPRKPADYEGTPEERRVWEALAAGPLDLDALTARAALPVRACLGAVTALELAGVIECALTGEIRRR